MAALLPGTPNPGQLNPGSALLPPRGEPPPNRGIPKLDPAPPRAGFGNMRSNGGNVCGLYSAGLAALISLASVATKQVASNRASMANDSLVSLSMSECE